ncbi:MAG: D-alanine--D-alanine ligase [Candidatus Campbellbacteria bacterium]|nr:D-alanine--D-alanine ligase [Candidatus Campbellbacteria bacterium]
MTKIRVGVLRGGPSNEYDISLKTGKTVLDTLEREKYEPVDIFIDKAGQWHADGFPLAPEHATKRVDVVFNALHGAYGEDGEVQRILESTATPYTGSRSFASALAMHKGRTKEVLAQNGIKTPPHIIFDTRTQGPSDVLEIFKTFPNPSVVKPVADGSSFGVSIVRKFDDLGEAIERASKFSPEVLIEAFVNGKEATCGVIEDFKGEKVYTLLPIEIIPPKESAFFDSDAKYGGGAEERCPGRFSREETQAIQDAARATHQAVGASHYSRTDCMVTPRGDVYVLEINTLPGLTSESLFPKSLNAVGVPLAHFLDHIVTLAYR